MSGFLLLLPWSSPGQGEIGILTGISNYQGDLSSFRVEGGVRALVHPVIGIHAGIEKSDAFTFRGDLLYTRISGEDALNPRQITRERNLDFFSPIVQLAIGVDWHLFGFSQEKTNDFSPYASAGASIFYFNPKTVYQGKTISLRPLGTEGQYLRDYPNQKPYSLLQPSLQFGGGLKIKPAPNLIMALEAMMSLTFTDYLDDASTIYISYPELLAKAGPLTAALANRQGELLGTEPVVVPTGSIRANAKSKDYFGVITVRLYKTFDITKKQFRIRHRNHKRIHCPTF